MVIAGKDRGKIWAVLAAFPKKDRVIVEGVGMVKKHRRATRRGQQGQIVDRPTPVHVSNVAFKDMTSGKPSRVGYSVQEGKKVRVSKKSDSRIA